MSMTPINVGTVPKPAARKRSRPIKGSTRSLKAVDIATSWTRLAGAAFREPPMIRRARGRAMWDTMSKERWIKGGKRNPAAEETSPSKVARIMGLPKNLPISLSSVFDDLAKSFFKLFCEAVEGFPPPPGGVNPPGSTPTPAPT